MKQLKRVLFPVDFSSHCAQVGVEVFAAARQWGVEIVALHALGLPAGSDEEWQAFLQLVEPDKQQEMARQRLSKFVRDEVEGVACRRVVVSGHPAKEILAAVDREGVDVVMMPRRGLTAFDSFLFGSVAERVLHKAMCPVWTEGQDAESAKRYEDVLCAVDLGPASLDVVEWAATVAGKSGAKLRLLHVGHGDGAQVELKHLAERVGVEANCQVQSGPVDEVILREAELHGADLIVIGRGEERQLLGRFRSHAHSIIHRSACAVLSV